MRPILFLKPVFKEMIWGGSRLKEQFGYEIPGDHTGECWAISAHPNGDCIVKEGPYEGRTLSEMWTSHPELFGSPGLDRFPLLIKIIDAKDDLSIQVHPDDAYAKEHENGSLGKTECWYILDCKEDARIVIGHNAKTQKELEDMAGAFGHDPSGEMDGADPPDTGEKGRLYSDQPRYGTCHQGWNDDFGDPAKQRHHLQSIRL